MVYLAVCVARDLSDGLASNYVLAGDELLGVFSGKWTSPVLDPGKNIAALAGGLLAASLVSRDGERGWVVVTRWAMVVVGASKVTGGPAKPIDVLAPDVPLELTGRRGNKLAIAGLTLAVDRRDIAVVNSLMNEPRPVPVDWSTVPGGWPYQRFSRARAAMPPPPVSPSPGPADHEQARGDQADWSGSSMSQADRAAPSPAADRPITGLADLFSRPPGEEPSGDR